MDLGIAGRSAIVCGGSAGLGDGSQIERPALVVGALGPFVVPDDDRPAVVGRFPFAVAD